jgi:hypothetical protein
MIERETGGPHQKRLQLRAADHGAARYEAVGADHIAAGSSFRDHRRLNDTSVEIIVGGKHQDERGHARGEPGHHRLVHAPAAIFYEFDGEVTKLVP